MDLKTPGALRLLPDFSGNNWVPTDLLMTYNLLIYP